MPSAEASESAPLVFTESATPIETKMGGAANASRSAAVASKIDASSSEVARWGNGEAIGAETIRHEDGAEDATPAETPAGKPSIAKPTEKKPDASAEEAPPEAETEETPAVAAKPTVDAERRKEILKSLDREKNRVDAENRIKEEQTKREAAEAKLAEFEKSPLGKKIAQIAKQHGMTVDDLKDKLLIGADDVLDKEPAAPAKPETPPEVAELLKWKADREKAEGDARIAQAVGNVRDALKEADLPMIDSLDSYGRVLVKAHDGWVAGGKKGTVSEYVPDAAAIVEDELKAERPALAKRLYKSAEEATSETTDLPDPPRVATPRPAMGKRQAARPGTRPAPLPSDPEERDRAIKKRYGWA